MVSLLVGFNVFAEGEEDVDIYLKNGKVVPGQLNIVGSKNIKAFGITSSVNENLSLDNVDSIICKIDSAVLIPLKWIEHAELPLNKEHDWTILERIYQGKNIDGYVGFAMERDVTHTGSVFTYRSSFTVRKFYYHVKNEEFAYSYFKQVQGNSDANARMSMKMVTKKTHPALYEYMKTDDFKRDSKGLCKDPEILLPLFDKAFDN